jgi:thiol-disulfide isomerase/thioredoxin
MILLVPVVIWLANAGDQTDVIGENTVDLGDDAPSFTVDLFGGGHFSLEDHLSTDGRPVVLNFWASWCVPCREEMPAFDTVAQRRPDVLFIGVAVQDSAESAMAFADEVAVSYPLGLDDDGQILELYPILGLPTTTLITGNGNIATTWSGQLDAERLESLIDEHLTP